MSINWKRFREFLSIESTLATKQFTLKGISLKVVFVSVDLFPLVIYLTIYIKLYIEN